MLNQKEQYILMRALFYSFCKLFITRSEILDNLVICNIFGTLIYLKNIKYINFIKRKYNLSTTLVEREHAKDECIDV